MFGCGVCCRDVDGWYDCLDICCLLFVVSYEFGVYFFDDRIVLSRLVSV